MERNDFRLVIRDVPVFLWVFGGIFTTLGVAGLYQQGVRMPVVGYIVLAAGLCVLLSTSALKITADRVRRTLKLEYRSLLRYAEKEIPFDEIEGISVQRSRGTRTTTYRVALKRKDGTVVPFRRYYSSASGKYMRQAQALRDFIGVEAFDDAPRPQADPSVQPFLERPRETNGVRWQLVPGRNFGPRWHSVDFKTQDVFVCVMQKSANQSSLGGFGARQGLKAQGFEPADTPGFEQSDILEPFDPMIDPCFVVCTNAPDAARWVLNPKVTQALADWAGHHPLKMFNRPSSIGQLVALFSPNGVFLGTWNLSNSEQVNELAALGAALVNSQKRF